MLEDTSADIYTKNRKSDGLKEEMILCLLELAKDKTVKDQGTSEKWTELINRRGLRNNISVVSCLGISKSETF